MWQNHPTVSQEAKADVTVAQWNTSTRSTGLEAVPVEARPIRISLSMYIYAYIHIGYRWQVSTSPGAREPTSKAGILRECFSIHDLYVLHQNHSFFGYLYKYIQYVPKHGLFFMFEDQNTWSLVFFNAYIFRDIENQKRSNTCWQEALEEKHVEIPAEAGLGHVEVNVYVCPPVHIKSHSTLYVCSKVWQVSTSTGAREPTSRASILRGCFSFG